jgi:hypothetical protein
MNSMVELRRLEREREPLGAGQRWFYDLPRIPEFVQSWFVEIWEHDEWDDVMVKLILGFSDQQLVMGLGIMVVAFWRLPSGQITIYHFNLALRTAWFSGNVHLVTLTVLRKYLIDNAAVKLLRLFLMFSLGVLLLTASFLGMNKSSQTFWNCPAACLTYRYQADFDESNGTSIVLLLIMYIGFTLSFFKHVNEVWDRAQRRWSFGTVMALYVNRPFLVFMHTAWFGLGVFQAVVTRRGGEALMTASNNNENEMGFGQILTIFLIILNVLTAFEFYTGTAEFLVPFIHKLMAFR